LSGSRNAFAPLMLWYAFHTVGVAGFRRRVQSCFQVADYAIDELRELGRKPWRHHWSNTVVFDRPPEKIVQRWQLAVEHDIAHLLIMPHVDRARIDRFIADLAAADKEKRR
jgi:histidine decarboxylase